jgi:hypothetical protein
VRIEDARVRETRWIDGSVYTDPSAGYLLADTGPIFTASRDVGTIYEYVVVASSTAPAWIVVEHRAAYNNDLLESFDVLLPAGVVVFYVPVRIFQNDRVRVVLRQDITGSITVSLLETRAYD